MPRFHEHLYQLILKEQPSVVVETGYSSGMSAMHILAAMDANAKGVLYSVESFTNQDIFHPRLKFVRGFSYDKLPEIYRLSGPWNIFLHDSDHEIGCTTFEYELAWGLLTPGGILATDDYEWGNPPHNSWKKFLSRHDHLEITTVGSVQHCRKPFDSPYSFLDEMKLSERVKNAIRVTNQMCKEAAVEPYFPAK
jgi:hypothetical protein